MRYAIENTNSNRRRRIAYRQKAVSRSLVKFLFQVLGLDENFWVHMHTCKSKAGAALFIRRKTDKKDTLKNCDTS